jgi:hypothetical protein
LSGQLLQHAKFNLALYLHAYRLAVWYWVWTSQHLIEVQQGVFQVFADKSAAYELMTGELVAKTLWQIFIDVPACFSTT